MTQGDGTFDVVPSEVSDAGRYVQLTAQELVDGVRTLDTEIGVLLQGWTGVSATAYRAGWEETRQGAQTVLDALATLAELMGVTADTHTQLDTDRATDTSSLDLP
ncbi:WXG100 family type VII secretion target [Nocardia higoensis]|uniref:ESAT-6-like protein n=1 Tax=Nocardia higoensis TaxID=228599 RepID=A0ABS0D5L5_9NOCA|nr:WXG100 family type VII secretion target [Nocardia higoensis]MBF6353636.1 WXG100 family type VII secretion target [Nocardia higoensis]